MTQDVTPHRFIDTALGHPRAPGVPKIMKRQVTDTGVLASAAKCMLDVFHMRACHRITENISIRSDISAESLQNLPY